MNLRRDLRPRTPRVHSAEHTWVHSRERRGDVRPIHNGPLARLLSLNGGAIDRPKNVQDSLQNRYPAHG